MKPYNIELSTERNQPVETNIKLCQGDNNITFNINISDFDLTGTTVKIVFTQSNGTSVENSAIVNSDKKSCTYNIVGNELQSVGKVVADLKIYDVNNKRLSSACFIFYVELDSLSDGSFPPKNYSASLEKALAECDAATQAALEAVQKVVNIANNLATTEEGFALDARQGKVLNDKITTLNESLMPVNRVSDLINESVTITANTPTTITLNKRILANEYERVIIYAKHNISNTNVVVEIPRLLFNSISNYITPFLIGGNSTIETFNLIEKLIDSDALKITMTSTIDIIVTNIQAVKL